MTKEEINAIEKAIVAGINTAFEKILVNPFPKPRLNQEPDYSSILFHAKSKIESAVRNELSKIPKN